MSEIRLPDDYRRTEYIPEWMIKEEFLSIRDYYIGKPITPRIVEDVYNSYRRFFEKYDLRDIQYRIISGHNTLTLRPTRIIDELAIEGILSRVIVK